MYYNDNPVAYCIDKPIKYQTKEQIINQRVHEEMASYLYHWYKQNGLKIDYKTALKYVYDMKELKMKRLIDWDRNANTGKKKYPVQQYHSAIINIQSIGEHDYNAHKDDNIHRLHSRLTSLQKECRNFVSYSNENLVSIDIKNSQPYLANVLFNPSFWDKNDCNSFCLYDLPKNIQDLILKQYQSPTLPDKIKGYLKKINIEEVSEYQKLTSQGKMYEEIMKVAEIRTGQKIERKDAKTMMFIVFFSQNKFQRWLKKFFTKLYPNIYGLFEMIKEKNHATLACLLQAIESEIILNRCCQRIWEKGNHQIPIFTIHDSIITTVENQDLVRRIMEETLSKCIGVKPALEIEAWHESNLKKEKNLPVLYDNSINQVELNKNSTNKLNFSSNEQRNDKQSRYFL